MRSASLSVARLVLLAGPTALAFFSGGYFDEARAWAGLGAWSLVVAGLLLRPSSLPRGRSPWFAVAGLGLLAAWTLLSTFWAPIAGDAYHAAQVAFLYFGALLAGAVLLRSSSAQGAVEPALAVGTMVVIGYGLSERLLPGVFHFARSISAEGRLEQPLTYWNAMGEIAALGLVLCVRLAGDSRRGFWLRSVAAASTAPVGMGLYISFSRGALFAGAAGLLALAVLVPRREQLSALILALTAAIFAAASAAPFGGVTSLNGSIASRERGGAIALVLLAVIMLAAGGVQRLLINRVRAGEVRLPRRAPWIAAALVCGGLAAAIVLGSKESSGASQPLSGGSSRLVTLQSNRYDYWNVAMRAFATEPITGVGAGNWDVYWLRWRPINDFAQDAHSLPLQTLAELGVVGLALLLAFFGGVLLAGRTAYRLAPGPAAGPLAGLVVYVAHAPLDWDWQMPAVTLVALVLAAALLTISETRSESTGVVEPLPAAAPDPSVQGTEQIW